MSASSLAAKLMLEPARVFRTWPGGDSGGDGEAVLRVASSSRVVTTVMP